MRFRLLALSLALCFAPKAQASTADALRGAADSSRRAQGMGIDESKFKAGRGFDNTGIVSPPLVPIPAESRRRPAANLIVGEPGKHEVKEPKNPLTRDGQARTQKSGNTLWWSLGGAAVGAAAGFFLGGPVGALIGALAGGLLGFFLGP